MKHSIRINGEVKEIDCELGSGILDKNGREIFEGDKVKVYKDLGYYTATVLFVHGRFGFFDVRYNFHFLAEFVMCGNIEIVDD